MSYALQKSISCDRLSLQSKKMRKDSPFCMICRQTHHTTWRVLFLVGVYDNFSTLETFRKPDFTGFFLIFLKIALFLMYQDNIVGCETSSPHRATIRCLSNVPQRIVYLFRSDTLRAVPGAPYGATVPALRAGRTVWC